MKCTKPLTKQDKSYFNELERQDWMTEFTGDYSEFEMPGRYIVWVKLGDKKKWVWFPNESAPHQPQTYSADATAQALAKFDELAGLYSGEGEGVRLTQSMYHPEIVAAAKRLGCTVRDLADEDSAMGDYIIRQS